jgi:hypothetical protein
LFFINEGGKEGSMTRINDELKRKIIGFLYDLNDDLKDDGTKDEYITRVFRGETFIIIMDDDKITNETFGIFWEELNKIVDFCKENGLTVDIDGSRKDETIIVKIRVDDSNKMVVLGTGTARSEQGGKISYAARYW